MSLLSVSLFGRFRAQCGQQVLEGIDTRKVQELFCYLLLNRGHPHPREILASLLWGDYSTAQSKSYLRKALWQLQTALDLGAPCATHPVLLVEPEWIQLNPEADMRLDVADFERAFTLTQGMPGRELDLSQAQTLEHAVSLYQGDLLEGCYHDWCLYERERLQHLYLAMLDKLMDYSAARQEYEAGLAYGSRILRYDRARERTHRRLMHLYYLAGDRSEALRQYERCAAALGEELGVEPAKQTKSLYAQIRADHIDGRPGTQAKPETAREPTALLPPNLLQRLKQLQAALADLQRQLQQDIWDVESSANDPG
jgi:DNA-binding SARP family transcriptional activator